MEVREEAGSVAAGTEVVAKAAAARAAEGWAGAGLAVVARAVAVMEAEVVMAAAG